MRRIAKTFIILGAAATMVPAATGQGPQPRRQAPARASGAAPATAPMDAKTSAPDPAAMDRLLGLWARQNGKLSSLTVGFVRVDKSVAFGQLDEFVGNAYLQTPNLACLHFKKVDRANPKAPKADDHERIVCTGQEVRQYDFKTKQIFVFPLDKNERKKAIQEGPLPFLFNMKADEAKLRYTMTLLNQDQTAYLIGIVPRLEQDRSVFSKAFLQLNKTTFLPDHLLLVDTNGKDTQDYKFTSVSPDKPINPVFFQALNIKGWQVVVNPGPETAQPSRGEAAARPEPPSARAPVGARPGTSSRRPR